MAAGANDRSIYVRLGVRDADAAVRQLEQFGARGGRAVQAITTATAPASRGLLAVNAAAGEVRQSFGALVTGAGSAGRVLGAIGPAGLAAAAGIGAATLAFRSFDRAVSEADAMVKFADNVGVNVEVLQEFRFAAARSGLAVQQFDVALSGFTRRLGEARSGAGELLPILRRYGIELADTSGQGRAVEDVLGDLADALKGVSDPLERARIGSKAFGEEAGVRMLNLLRNGRQGMEDLREEARRVGVVLEEGFARDAEKARDALDTFGEIISGKVNRGLLSLAPAATAAAGAVSELLVYLSKVRLIGSDNSELGRKIAEVFGGAATATAASVDELQAQLDAALAQLELDLADEAAASDATVKAYFRGVAESTRREIARLREALKQQGAEVEVAVSTAVSAPVVDLGPYIEATRKIREAVEPALKLERERLEAIAKVNEARRVGAIEDAAADKLIRQLNESYKEQIDKANGTTEALKEQADATKRLREESRKAADENARIVDGVNNLRASYDRGYAALKQYNEEVAQLDRALDRGLISEREHADLLDKVEQGYRRAKAEAASYGAVVSTIPNPSARALSPVNIGTLLPDVSDFAKQTLSTGAFPSLDMLRNFAVSKVGGSIFDNLFAGNNPLSGLTNFFKGGEFFSGITNSISSGLAQIAPGVGNAIASAIGISQGLGPAGLLTGGLGPGGAGGAVASQIAAGGLAQAGFAAALPGIGIAVAGLALILSKVFGPGKSSGPALGATFNADDGGLDIRAFGADNKADPEQAKALGDAVVQFTSAFLDASGATLKAGAFAGEVGFESGEFASAISSPGLTEGDRRSGRSPDLRRFGGGEGAAERATADFVVRSLIDALDRGLVEGLSDAAASTVRVVLDRLDRDGGAATLAEAGEALDFAVGFEDSTARMAAAGNAAALQFLDLADAAKAFGDQQAAVVKDFREKLEQYFGVIDREVDVPGSAAVDASGRVSVSSLTRYDPGIDGQSGFSFGGSDYLVRYGERGLVQFENAASGELIDGSRDAEGNLYVLADAIGAVGDAVRTVRDFGDPERMQQGMDALGAYIDEVLGLTDDVSEPLTGASLRLRDGLGKIEALQGALEELGLSSEQIADKVSAAGAKLRDTVRQDFDEGIQGRIVGLRSPNAAAILSAADEFERLLREAQEVGGNEAQVRELFELQAAALARQDEVAQINEGIAARSAEISALEQVRSAAEAIARQTRTTRDNLLIAPNLSPLSPTAQLDEAVRQFDAAVEAATAGDEDAARRANELASQVVALGRTVNASSAAQATLFGRVDRGLADIAGRFQSDADVARSSLDELRGIRTVLQERLGGLNGGSSSSRSFGANPTRNRLVAQLFPEFEGDFGSGGFDTFLRGVSSTDPRRDALASLSQIAFAEGGDHVGGLRLVGERGPELEKTGASRIHSAAETSNILRAAVSGGAETAGIMSALLSEFRAMRSAFSDLSSRLVEIEAGNASRRFAFNTTR
ncbi:hypothetical protein [Thalassobaculum sp.]|uniref:hypothetical protein n=1 Tax=Thalassobaculum sp. TaxID=2022740 RepID=UPI0032EC3649